MDVMECDSVRAERMIEINEFGIVGVYHAYLAT